MPVNPLPPNPNLAHLKSQARDLLRARASRDPQVAQRIREFHPHFHGCSDASIFDAQFRLSDAQLTIARERGFASWTRARKPSRSIFRHRKRWAARSDREETERLTEH